MTAEQIYKKYKNFLSGITKEEAINAIRIIQKDAYNEAITDVLSLIENHKAEVYITVVNDIKKLTKQRMGL